MSAQLSKNSVKGFMIKVSVELKKKKKKIDFKKKKSFYTLAASFGSWGF